MSPCSTTVVLAVICHGGSRTNHNKVEACIILRSICGTLSCSIQGMYGAINMGSCLRCYMPCGCLESCGPLNSNLRVCETSAWHAATVHGSVAMGLLRVHIGVPSVV